MKRLMIITLTVVGLLAFGFFVPLGSYTDHGSCALPNPPTVHVHLILGQTLQQHKDAATQPEPYGTGCTGGGRYVQYLL